MILLKVRLPIEIERPRSKNFKLNLNIYRNLHYQTNNSMKKKFAALLGERIQNNELITVSPLLLTYRYYHGSRRKFDISNVCSIIDKFTCDALISLGILPEDNITIIPEVRYIYGGINKNAPYCDLEITQLRSK